jgi:NADH:ubiquinone oxidoreductase subunit D
LAVTNRPPLTTKEKIGCASFARYVYNLNELTESDRLTALLAEDLESRRTSTRNKEAKKASKKQKSKKQQTTVTKTEKGTTKK